jgi:hypothetical protein
MVPPRTLAESALNDSLHSINDSEWSVVSNSDNDIYVISYNHIIEIGYLNDICNCCAG